MVGKMSDKKNRVEILVGGLVQGVGFRYYILKNAVKLGLVGFTKNLYTGEVLTIAEGEKYKLEELVKLIKIGPTYADVRKVKLKWGKPTGEFNKFEVRY